MFQIAPSALSRITPIMSTSSETSDSKTTSALSAVERPIQFRYALIAVSLILAINVGRAPLHALGLPEFVWSEKASSLPLGLLLSFAGSYLFFMAALSPAIQCVVEWVWGKLQITPLYKSLFGHSTSNVSLESMYRAGRVKIHDAEHAAIVQKDDFWIKRVEERLHQLETNAKEGRLLAKLSFACMLLACTDYVCGEPSSWLHTAARRVALEPGFLGLVMQTVGLLAIVLVVMPWIWEVMNNHRTGDDSDWITHPELAAEQLKKLKPNPASAIY
jgi:hypothetical protein